MSGEFKVIRLSQLELRIKFLLKSFTYSFLINFAIRLKNKYLSKFTHTLVLK